MFLRGPCGSPNRSCQLSMKPSSEPPLRFRQGNSIMAAHLEATAYSRRSRTSWLSASIVKS